MRNVDESTFSRFAANNRLRATWFITISPSHSGDVCDGELSRCWRPINSLNAIFHFLSVLLPFFMLRCEKICFAYHFICIAISPNPNNLFWWTKLATDVKKSTCIKILHLYQTAKNQIIGNYCIAQPRRSHPPNYKALLNNFAFAITFYYDWSSI